MEPSTRRNIGIVLSTALVLVIIGVMLFIMDYFDKSFFRPFGITFAGYIFPIFGIILVIAGLVMMKSTRDEEKLLYKVQKIPPTEIEDANEGVLLKISGKVSSKPFEGPFSKQDCVWARSVREEYVESGSFKSREGGHWKTVEDRITTKPFEIDDGTGKIAVDLEGVLAEHIDGKEVDTIGSFTDMHSRTYEWILPAGKLLIIGKTKKIDGKLVIAKSEDEPLVASFRGEKEYFKHMRSDDKPMTIFSYGLLIGGILVLIWSMVR
ncbi:MAG: GIDE domain-containing protein [Candidatus Micrarchaeota archaeon]